MLRRDLLKSGAAMGLISAGAATQAAADDDSQDWANLGRYAAANAVDAARPSAARRCVFMGDSITEMWAMDAFGAGFMSAHGFIGRGISGQTTPQMLVRFYPDVIALRPHTVHILAGINDIAGNTGAYRFEHTRDSIAAMILMARAARIRVAIGSVLPANRLPWRPEAGNPSAQVRELNDWIRRHCARHDLQFVDYFDAMADAHGGLRQDYAGDAVHPNAAGFRAMAPLALAAIRRLT